MKLSVYGFLLSSSLLSTHIIFAESSSDSASVTSEVAKAADNTELSTGFDGSAQPTPGFTSKDTSNPEGTTYTLKADISFSNITTITTEEGQPLRIKSNSNEGSCFTNTQGDLSFAGDSHSLAFTDISLTGQGAAISNKASGKTLNLSNISNLTFSSCPGTSASSGKGAIFCQGSSLQVKDNTNVVFSNNHSTDNGGAICYATTPPPPEPPEPAPEEGTTSLTKLKDANLGSIPSPVGTMRSSTKSAEVPDNSVFTFEGNSGLTFSGNSSDKNGGAIYAKNLTIISGGPTLFTDNTAKEAGGAIAIADSGTLSLTAESGDIIFKGNKGKNGAPNAIDIGSKATITDLRASQGSSIIFYDPITFSSGAESALADTESTLKINAPDAVPEKTTLPSMGKLMIRAVGDVQPTPKSYTGKVVFCGESATNVKGVTNIFLFPSPVELTAGTLVLSDGALFSAQSFTQANADSCVILEQNTQLQASKSLDLKNLWVNIKNLNSSTFARVSATGSSGSVTISGPVIVAISDPDFYENPDLAQQLSREFLKVSATKGEVTVSNNSDATNDKEEAHLGYQGIWKLTWENSSTGGSGNEKIAILHWQPLGYIPTTADTQSYTALVPNSLWGMVADVTAIQRLIEGEAHSATGKDIWGAGLSNFFQAKKTNKNRKFRNFSSGYAVGVSSESLHKFKFSFGLSQLFGRAKDYGGARIHEKILSGSLYTEYSTELLPILKFLAGTSVFKPKFLKQVPEDFLVKFQSQCGYFYGDNSMKIKYADATQTHSSWENHCYAGDIGASITLPIKSKDGILQKATPFVKVQSVYIYQKGFHEKGLRRRAFSHTYLTNISIPLGLRIHGDSPSKDLHYELSAAYIGDAYRHNPKNTTTPLVTNVVTTPWITTATNLQRHAARFECCGDYALTSYIHLFAQGSIELRKSARGYHANAGSSIHF
ncbi:autotransporter domain-containing protein [Chlamydia psittaci]|uniref:autotransporter domain-containing protein n=1 Tax=Chlamydia psittaci TaxID=83554 RepID=UPI000FCB54F7|nr:polymorphic outer membrane protein middle domain-containing protein [Chlamydia psittaci]AZU10435.1 autotransporter domain-containing protein [Chlamydia psittaci]